MKNKYLVCMMAFLGLGLADLFYLNSQIIPSFWPAEISVDRDTSAKNSETAAESDQKATSLDAPDKSGDTGQDSIADNKSELTAHTEKQKLSEEGIQQPADSKAESEQQALFKKGPDIPVNAMESPPPVLSSNPYPDTTGHSFEADNQASEPSLLARVVVRFDSGEFRLASEEIRKLQSKLDELDLSNKIRVTIDGYTDHTGAGKVDNDLLSQQRADYVAAILIKGGMLRNQITAAGHGDSNPVDLDRTEAAWAKNRRVEIKIFKDKS